jgi:hypothetical protein
MVDRRSVLKVGAASVAGALVGLPLASSGATRADSSTSLRSAVFAAQFTEAVAFADELQARGVATRVAGYDIAQLWYRDGLSGAMPAAGLTDRATLFCLEELARSAGMHVIYRVDHLIDDQGNAEHHAAGPASVMEAAHKLASKQGFGREMAVLASRFKFGASRNTAALKRTGPFSPGNKVALVSWVIA